MGIGHVLEDSVLAVLQVAFLIGAGAYLARRGILDPPSSRALSRAVFACFYPCLLFASIGSTITPSELLKWWPMPVVCLAVCGTGFALGHLAVWATGYGARPAGVSFPRGVVAACTLRTSAYVPIIIASSLFGGRGAVELLPSDYDGCGTALPADCATAYIGFYVVFIVIANWVFMYAYLADSEYGRYESLLGNEPMLSAVAGEPGAANASEAVAAATERGAAARARGKTPGNGGGDDSATKARLIEEQAGAVAVPAPAPRMTLRDRLVRLLNPPTVAIMAALFVGMVGPLRRLIFEGGDAADAFVRALHLLGRCAAPCAIVLTGSSLGRGLPTSPAIRTRDVVAVTVVNLVVTPLLVGGALYFADQGGAFSGQNNIFKFVMMLEATTPTNSNLVIICQLVPGSTSKARALAVLIFWQYAAALVCLTLWVFADLYYLFGAP